MNSPADFISLHHCKQTRRTFQMESFKLLQPIRLGHLKTQPININFRKKGTATSQPGKEAY